MLEPPLEQGQEHLHHASPMGRVLTFTTAEREHIGDFWLWSESGCAETAILTAEKGDDDVRHVAWGDGKHVELQELQEWKAGLGHAIWPASVALLLWLEGRPQFVERAKILELGAGVGLVSFGVAAIKSPLKRPHRIVLTDLSDILVENMKRNFSRNLGNGSIFVKQMEMLNMNWDDCTATNFEPNDTYDLIIGSDVVYNLAHPISLPAAIFKHLVSFCSLGQLALGCCFPPLRVCLCRDLREWQ
mmetsp:Transcript_12963/g.47395  ORF Transcript_12963/g.47395 Transcript_12963/m.47395 type:complete len:245 (-) Transcript_12963:2048-2782(-)